MPAIRIGTKKFAGGAGINNGQLALAIRGIAQFQARTAIVGTTGLTDNSGGPAANGTVDAIPSATGTPIAGASCPTKAEIESAFGQVKDAYTEIAAQVMAINAKLPVFDARANLIGGAAADRTIGAITQTITGATSGRVSKAGFNAVALAVRVLNRQLVRDVNMIAVAVDASQLVHPVTTSAPFVSSYPVLSVDTGAAAADGTTSVVSSEAAATLVAMAGAVKELATKLNAITSAATGQPAVIAI